MRNMGVLAVCGAVCGAMIGLASGAAAQEGPITIRIELEPSVSERLIAMGEWVTVSAFYTGEPARADVPVDELGQVYLGGEEIRIYPVSQSVRLNGLAEGTPRNWSKVPFVNVNVFTSRFVDEMNLIDCTIVDDAIAIVAGAENVITCAWLGG